MKRLFASIAALLVIVFTAFGCATPGGPGWDTLIDGEKGMENWNKVGDANWRAEGGAIVGDKGKGGFLMSKKSYKDFELYIEFWPDHTANSGIYMRCADGNNPTDRTCYEANIFDQRADQSYATGGIVHRAVVNPAPKAGGKWNTYEIHMKGTQLTVKLNGVVTAFMEDKDLPSGPFGLQFGNRGKEPGGAIKFRKVMIREL
ncbi:MAG: DUF1080 domain-containing protein [Betaproteobacteria bacterium]|nr:DUF1080 domain-containing protein [Betaproteobacteria bacterium]